jgi:alpha/beta superfamily hydrolase
VTLQCDVLRSDEAIGVVVVCHPHPQYGGDRFNPVVDAAWRAAHAAGFTALRFDFRGVEQAGRDALEAIDLVTEDPLYLIGYSFGAEVALSLVPERIAGVVAIAPPLSVRNAAPRTVPTLILSAEHDQFRPYDMAVQVAGAWPHTTIEPIPGADHFLAGFAQHVADRAVSFLRDLDPTR